MSYCRWSSDNWKCDLYCYESSEGYVTHVAARKRVGEIPEVPNILTTPSDAWIKAYKEHMDAVEKAELVPIGLSEDGKTFNDPDLESFLETVKLLKNLGYHVPDYVIEEIHEEIAAEGGGDARD